MVETRISNGRNKTFRVERETREVVFFLILLPFDRPRMVETRTSNGRNKTEEGRNKN